MIITNYLGKLGAHLKSGHAIDSLSSEITALSELLDSAKKSSDIVGELQLEPRLKALTDELNALKETTLTNRGRPVADIVPGRTLGLSRASAKQL